MNAADLDIRGPILASGKPPLVSRQSVQAAVQPKAISPNDLGPGIGQWIWCPAAKSGEPARFLRSITLTEHPKLARGWITAEARYRMWINGRLAARGPADSGRDYDSGPCGPWLEDVRDLTPYFRKGENIVAVEVFANPLVQYDASTGHPGLKIDFRLQCGSKPVKEYGSDTKWLSAPAADLDQTGAKNGYRLNMVVEPAMWQIGQSIAPNWMPATLSHREKPETLVSELPQSLEAVIKPTGLARVSAGVTPNLSTGGAKFAQSGTYTLQFGHVLSGYIGMTVRGHKGSRIILTPNEHDAPGANRQSEILLRDGIQTFELPYYDSFSVINIKAEDISEPIEIVDVRCVFTSFPVQYTGEFSCSDPEFNRIWEVCRWVTQICMQTHHLDSPHHQEPISDAGDYLIESLNSFYAFGEGTLARQDLKKIARTLEQRQFQSFHTSYSLLWLRMLVQYYEYTGDSAPLKELAPQVEGLMRQFEGYIGKNGLISEAPNYMFMDWVEIDGYNLHHPPAVIGQGYMTALYYQALTDAQVVAKLSSSSGLSSYYEKRRNSIKAAFETELWNSAKGLYRDGKPFQTSVKPNQWMPADRDIETFSTQVNTLAVSCGLVEPSRAKMVMKSILDRSDMNCQPYFMHFVFEALSKSGLMSELADRQLRRWQIVPDTQSFHEMWTVGDLSHAWNATPMFQMSGRVLGVIPIKPGFEEFAVRPITLGLAWAKGKVPTPHGVIEVSWNKTGDQIRLEITVPKGTKARVGGRLVGPGKRQLFIGLADLNL
jgi:hypothetical protein